MKDMMMEVYNQLISNSVISEKVTKERIKFFQLPESFDTSKPFIILDSPLGAQRGVTFGSNEELSINFAYQLNVESNNRMLTKEIAKSVKDTMWSMGFGQIDGGIDTYFEDTKRYVDVRRYRKNTRLYDVNY